MARPAPEQDPAQDAPQVALPKHAAAGLPALLHTTDRRRPDGTGRRRAHC